MPAPLRWCKLWFDVFEDARTYDMSPEEFRAWIGCLVLAGQNQMRGWFDPAQLLWRLHLPDESLLDRLVARGLCKRESNTRVTVVRWRQRQGDVAYKAAARERFQRHVQSVSKPVAKKSPVQREREREKESTTQGVLPGPLGTPPANGTTPPVEVHIAPRPDGQVARPPAGGGDHQRLIDAFDRAYQEAYGARPTWGAKQGAMVKALLKRQPLAECLRRLDRLFNDTPVWLAKGGGAMDLGTFFQHFDKLATDGQVAQRDGDLGYALRRAAQEKAREQATSGRVVAQQEDDDDDAI